MMQDAIEKLVENDNLENLSEIKNLRKLQEIIRIQHEALMNASENVTTEPYDVEVCVDRALDKINTIANELLE